MKDLDSWATYCFLSVLVPQKKMTIDEDFECACRDVLKERNS